jgi:hypothetical protein
MHKCATINNVEVVAKRWLIMLNVNESSNKLYILFSFFSSQIKAMTTVEFGGGPTLDARRHFANLKDGAIIPK